MYVKFCEQFVEVWDGNELDPEPKIILRCHLDDTDCGMNERFSDFIERHGGVFGTLQYLRGRLQQHLSKHMKSPEYRSC